MRNPFLARVSYTAARLLPALPRPHSRLHPRWQSLIAFHDHWHGSLAKALVITFLSRWGVNPEYALVHYDYWLRLRFWRLTFPQPYSVQTISPAEGLLATTALGSLSVRFSNYWGPGRPEQQVKGEVNR